MSEEHLVRVEWDPPASVAGARSLVHRDNDYGLYQVYGVHPVTGPGTLLYIGKVDRQTFGKRVSQHRSWLDHVIEASVRVGRLRRGDYDEDPPAWSDWRMKVDAVERLTIYWHSPPYNSAHINAYTGLNVRVQNLGDRGRLLPEYSVMFGADRDARPPDEPEPL